MISPLILRIVLCAYLLMTMYILYKSIQTHNDCARLQDDLHAWEKTWLMKFNPTKCCVMITSLATKYKAVHDHVLPTNCESL